MVNSHLALAAVLLVAGAVPALAQDAWSWKKAVPAGRTIEIKGVNGDIRASAASGSEVEVVARKTAKRSDPEDVKIEVVEHAGGVTFCAVYPAPANKPANECRPDEGGRMNTRNNDTNVDWEVRVPRGVQFAGRTVNGSVRGNGLTANAKAHTVNGSIDLSTAGIAEAQTVNGSIDVTMGQANWANSLEFKTVNGSIVLGLPGSLAADVAASTVNGSFYSDWPLSVQGRFGPKKINGKIGAGGRDLELSTVNGNIELRKN